MNIADETDSYYVTCFNEEAEKILGVSAEDVGNFVQSQVQYMRFTVTLYRFMWIKIYKLLLMTSWISKYEEL